MKSNVGGIRLKLGTAVDSQPAAQLPYDQQKTGHVGARVLATRIAAHTVKVLLEGEMLDPASASDQLRNYESNLGKELNIGQCILLRFLFFPTKAGSRWFFAGSTARQIFASGRLPIAYLRLNSFTKPIPRSLRHASFVELLFSMLPPRQLGLGLWSRSLRVRFRTCAWSVAPCWAAFMRWSPALVPMPCKQSSNRGRRIARSRVS
jgi:hypothetical protein